MIEVKIREVAARHNVRNAYQLQKITGFLPSKAARLWKDDWQLADLNTLNTLCNIFKCTPNEILHFTPDDEDEIELKK
jgi:DNA-binding Xre family transcriptional regulator